MSYDDGYDDEPNMNLFNELMEREIIPKIDEVMESIIADEVPGDEIAAELQKRLFTDEIKEKLEDIGVSWDSCEGLEMNVYTMKVDDKSELVDRINEAESHEDMAQIISEAVSEKDKYTTHRSEDGVLSFNAFELKDKLTMDDVDPVSDDELKRMMGESDED